MYKNVIKAMFFTVKFNAFKIIPFLMYTVFGITVILLAFFFHLDEQQIALRAG